MAHIKKIFTYIKLFVVQIAQIVIAILNYTIHNLTIPKKINNFGDFKKIEVPLPLHWDDHICSVL